MDRRPERRLEGKVAIVTGAGTKGGKGFGVGRATAVLFAREGAKLVLMDAVEDWADGTREMIVKEGGEAIVVAGDITKLKECERTVETAVERYGTLNVLFNTVGIGVGGSVVEASDEDWQKILGVNMMGIVHMCKYAIPEMKRAGGSIINVSSVTALRPKPERSSAIYTVSKLGVVGLTHAMALDHARDHIRVNCVMPGLLWTPRHWGQTQDQRGERLKSTPLGIEGEGWDVAWAAVYLASDEARYITGVVIPVDGGFLLTSAPN